MAVGICSTGASSGGSAARRRKAVGMGAALASSFLAVALKQGTQVWLSAPVEELIVAGDGSFLRRNQALTRHSVGRGRFLSDCLWIP